MFLKKSAILAAVLAFSTASAFAASLKTENYTKLYSTVKLDNGKCAADFGKITPPGTPGVLNTSLIEVRAICNLIGKSGDCGAKIIMIEDPSQKCNGKEVGEATLTISGQTLFITKLESKDPAFKLDKVNEGGSSLVSIHSVEGA